MLSVRSSIRISVAIPVFASLNQNKHTSTISAPISICGCKTPADCYCLPNKNIILRHRMLYYMCKCSGKITPCICKLKINKYDHDAIDVVKIKT